MIDYQYFAGGLVAEPEIRYTPNGKGVVSFTLAQSRIRKNDQGEWETVENLYLPINLWDENPEYRTNARKWTEIIPTLGLTPGTKLVVRGQAITHQWQTKDGNNRSRIEVKASDVYIDAANDAPGAASTNGGWENTGNTNSAQDMWNQASNAGQTATTGGFGTNNDNQEPPF